MEIKIKPAAWNIPKKKPDTSSPMATRDIVKKKLKEWNSLK